MRASEFKRSVLEILWIIKTSLTTFWFWLPVLYAAYFYIQLWMIFIVHPLTIIILPTILSIYVVREEKKRKQARYQFSSTKSREATNTRWKKAQSTYFTHYLKKNMRARRDSIQEDEEQEEHKEPV